MLITISGITGPDSSWTIQGLLGATGPVGPVGPKGNTGNTGKTGATGPKGSSGPTGLQGSQGVQGPQGIQGPQGDQGPTGLVGPQGSQGPPGNQGESGSPGPQGMQGIQGMQGPEGERGSNGLAGPQGIQGPQGDQRPVGLTGSTGPQDNSTSYIIYIENPMINDLYPVVYYKNAVTLTQVRATTDSGQVTFNLDARAEADLGFVGASGPILASDLVANSPTAATSIFNNGGIVGPTKWLIYRATNITGLPTKLWINIDR